MQSLQEWLNDFDVFSDIDFTILYDWLPSDVESVVGLCLSFLFVLALIGIIRTFLLR